MALGRPVGELSHALGSASIEASDSRHLHCCLIPLMPSERIVSCRPSDFWANIVDTTIDYAFGVSHAGSASRLLPTSPTLTLTLAAALRLPLQHAIAGVGREVDEPPAAQHGGAPAVPAAGLRAAAGLHTDVVCAVLAVAGRCLSLRALFEA